MGRGCDCVCEAERLIIRKADIIKLQVRWVTKVGGEGAGHWQKM